MTTKTQKLTNKLIKEIIEKFPLMLKVHVPLECELTVRNVVTGEVFIGQKWRTESVLKNILKQVAEAAKAERDKEILEMLPKGYITTIRNASQRQSRCEGFWDCVDQVKAIINNNTER